jgi:hypothetical protein
MSSLQLPPFAQGASLHSSMFVPQVVPLKPGAHSQLKLFTASRQVPLF